MKIHNEQLQALQQQAEARGKQRQEGVFDAILSEELNVAQPGQTAPAIPMQTSGPLLGAATDASASQSAMQKPESTVAAMVTDSINAMLGGLDEYAEILAAPQGADLRKAYGILQGMDKDLAALRESAPDLATRHAGLASLVDEISVIAKAETVKLNRGDYL